MGWPFDLIFGFFTGPTGAGILAAVGAIFYAFFQKGKADKAKEQAARAQAEADAAKDQANAIRKNANDVVDAVAAGRGKLPDPATDPYNRDTRKP